MVLRPPDQYLAAKKVQAVEAQARMESVQLYGSYKGTHSFILMRS